MQNRLVAWAVIAVVAWIAAACAGAAPPRRGGSTTSTDRGDADPFTVGELPGTPAALRARLDAITIRGREIAQYEVVATAATDALLATNPDRSLMGIFLAVKQAETWFVYFGKLSADRASFEIAYAYSCQQAACQPTQATATAELAALARAIDVGQSAIEPKTDRYNVNVFREPDGRITVYYTPGSTTPGMMLFGGDYAVTVSADGNQVIQSVPLHMDLHRFPTQPPPDTQMVGTMMTNVLSELPNETDVSLVLLNPIVGPRLIICENWMYRIEKNGRIVVIVARK